MSNHHTHPLKHPHTHTHTPNEADGSKFEWESGGGDDVCVTVVGLLWPVREETAGVLEAVAVGVIPGEVVVGGVGLVAGLLL